VGEHLEAGSWCGRAGPALNRRETGRKDRDGEERCDATPHCDWGRRARG
jgi:hypothetical protein